MRRSRMRTSGSRRGARSRRARRCALERSSTSEVAGASYPAWLVGRDPRCRSRTSSASCGSSRADDVDLALGQAVAESVAHAVGDTSGPRPRSETRIGRRRSDEQPWRVNSGCGRWAAAGAAARPRRPRQCASGPARKAGGGGRARRQTRAARRWTLREEEGSRIDAARRRVADERRGDPWRDYPASTAGGRSGRHGVTGGWRRCGRAAAPGRGRHRTCARPCCPRVGSKVGTAGAAYAAGRTSRRCASRGRRERALEGLLGDAGCPGTAAPERARGRRRVEVREPTDGRSFQSPSR